MNKDKLNRFMSKRLSKRILIDGIHLANRMKGVGRYVANTIWRLSELDSTNEYWILIRDDTALPALPQNPRFHYLPVRLRNHLFHGMWLLPQQARRLRADVAWIPYDTTLGYFSCPYLIVCHDVPHLIFRAESVAGKKVSLTRQWMALVDASLHQRSLRGAAIVFCNSNFVKAWLQSAIRIPTEKIRYAPCAPGADFASLAQTMNREVVRCRLDCPRGYILVFATGDQRENTDSALQVYRQAVAQGVELNLVVAGVRQEDEPKIRGRINQLGLDAWVRVLPFYGENQMMNLAEVYAGADVYLDLSLHEGFGMQVIEAMVCGTPVVCSNAGALPEVAGEAALLIDVRDTNAIVEALQHIISDPHLRSSLVTRGWERAARYTWTRTATTILESFETL